jgi:hypothetical protein
MFDALRNIGAWIPLQVSLAAKVREETQCSISQGRLLGLFSLAKNVTKLVNVYHFNFSTGRSSRSDGQFA